MKRKFTHVFNLLIHTGIDETVTESEAKYIRTVNAITPLTTATIILCALFSVYQNNFLLACLQTSVALVLLEVLPLNQRKCYEAARYIYFTAVNFFVFISACLIGDVSRTHELFFVCAIIPFMLFSMRNYKHIFAGVLTSVILFNIYPLIYSSFTGYNFDFAMQLNILAINYILKFALFGISVFTLAYQNYSSEVSLFVSEKRLQTQAAELQRTNDDFEQFSYVISHDLKSPARNIGSFMKLLARQSESLSKDTKEFIEHSRVGAERLSVMIDDLLSYGRVGKNLPPISSVNLSEMLAGIQTELSEKISLKSAQVIILHRLPVLHKVHSVMIHRVFKNLIDNAIKFNKNENVQVTIDYKEDDEQFTFSVSDNGIGIAPECKDKIFQLFKRLHTAEQFEGTGTGLAMCKRIVHFYRGDIWFDSEPGKGTSFHFTLPKNIEEASTIPSPKIHSIAPMMKAA